MRRSIYKYLRISLLVGLVVTLGLAAFPPAKAYADSYYADGNGNGIPDGTEATMINTCNTPGAQTIWSMWVNPYSINPPVGTTNYQVGVYGAAYVCPGAPYGSITNAQFFNIAAPWYISMPVTNFSLNGASRGSFTQPNGEWAYINTNALPQNGCSNHRIDFSVSALHGGNYGSASSWANVQICFFPPAQQVTTVGGHVYNATTGAPMNNVQIGTCMGGGYPANVWTNSTGYFGFTVNQNTGYCLRLVGGLPGGSSVSAFWTTQWPYTKYHPNLGSYEWQLAGTSCFEAGGEGNIYCGDRNVYWGYDLNWPSPNWDSWGNQGMDFYVTVPDPTPIGNVDGVSCTSITGWTFDDSQPTTSIYVHLYIDGAFAGQYLANTSRPDVGNAYAGRGNNHGFDIPTPVSIKTGNHTVQVYAIGIAANGAQNGNNPLLGTRTQNLSCPVPPLKPYLTVFGADMQAGAVLSNTIASSGCSSLSSSSRIRGQRAGATNGSRGEYGVGATSTITDFGSNEQVSGNAATFGNTPSDGNFYRTICRPDFSKLTYDVTLASLNGGTNPGSYNLASLPASANGKVIRWAPKSGKRLSGTLAAGMRVTIISPDSVRILGDIRYKDSATDTPSYANTGEIPALMLVSGDDIVIDPAVRSMTGYYVANGAISTCSDDELNVFTPNILNSGGANTCRTSLHVFGALAAQNIYWRRTFGNAINGDESIGADMANAADVILMIPELYLVSPPGLAGDSGLKSFLGDLPPVF